MSASCNERISPPPAPVPALCELREISGAGLQPVFDEQVETWRRRFAWDCRGSVQMCRRFVDQRALAGYGLMIEGQPVGYTYWVFDDPKGLIGDLYILESARTPQNEDLLLGAAIQVILNTRHIRRIESQLMLLTPAPRRSLPADRYLRMYDRQFMQLDLSGAPSLPPGKRVDRFLFDRWADRYQDPAAHLIAAAYHGHIDSDINDQYRSFYGARRFLHNIVQYPGCGHFERECSFIAWDLQQKRVCGVSLASFVGEGSGHLTQICVAPDVRGAGVGYEMIRQSLQALRDRGAQRVSLTVTSANHTAADLYARMGFEIIRRFPALVWDGF